MLKSFASAAALVAATLAASTPALARDHAWQVGNDSYRVYVSDLDLKTAAGRAEALARVERTAGRLCEGVGVRAEVKSYQTQIVQATRGALRPVLDQARAERTKVGGVQVAQSQ